MYGTTNNPMLKGYVSHQERDQMRERERKSRCQIAQQASRDMFREQTSGAFFAEPIKVCQQDQQITDILGRFDCVAPIMRSERAQSSLVGTFAMPCTPAPVHQDHDHLFNEPLPPPPPPVPVSRERRPMPLSAAHRHLPPPPLLPPAASHHHHPLNHQQQQSTPVKQQRPQLRLDKHQKGPPELETILREMRVPVTGLVTPLKVGPTPFQFPTSATKLSPVTAPQRDITPERTASRDQPRPPPAQTARAEERRWRQPPPPRQQQQSPPPARPATAPAPAPAQGNVKTSLSDDLTLSEDSDEETSPQKPASSQPQQPSTNYQSSPSLPARGQQAATTTASDKAAAASSGSSSESEGSESPEESDDSESETEERRPAPADPAASAGSGGGSSGEVLLSGGSAEHQDDSESPGTNTGSKWSLLSIMKDPGGTPLSSIFGDTPARSTTKLSPQEFPNSAEPTGPSSSEPPELERNEDDVLSVEELPAPASQRHQRRGSHSPAGPADMAISDDAGGSSGSEADPGRAAALASASVRSTGGGKRPRPRLSARESDSEQPPRPRRPSPRSPRSGHVTRRTTRSRYKQAGGRGDLSDSEGEGVERPAPPPTRRAPVPSKGSLKGAVVPGGRTEGSQPGAGSQYPSKELLSTASESSDEEVTPPTAASVPLSRQDALPVPRQRLPTVALDSSDEETPSAKPEPRPRRRNGSASDSDSPPKLDSGGVSTSDPNKKATFNRVFFRRLGAKRSGSRGAGRPGASASERSDTGHSSPSAQPQTSQPPPSPPPPPPLPTLSWSDGVPVLRCRLEKRLLSDLTSPEVEMTSVAAPEPPSSPHRTEVMDCENKTSWESTVPPEAHQTVLPETEDQKPPIQKPDPDLNVQQQTSASKKRRRRTSERSGSRRKKLRQQQEANSSTKSEVTSGADDGSCSLHVHTPAVGSDPALRRKHQATPTGDLTCPNGTAPANQTQHEHRIESPPTGVREADSSTNPSVLQSYDSNIPAALYTNQPFPIPATSWFDARSTYVDPSCPEDPAERDQNQYLKQARRLKRAADNENDLTLKVIRYTQAVLYFLLTALSTDDSDESETMLALLHDTLKLIKDMMRLSSATYRKQGRRPSPIDTMLQTLLLRSQGLIYLRMYKLKEAEHRKVQRHIAELKSQILCDTADEEGRSTCSVPRDLLRLLFRCSDTQVYLQNWLEFWEQADEMMQRTQGTADFYADIDRTMGGLLATSTLLELVYYIRETTRRLEEVHVRSLELSPAGAS